jgi:hypothetical protein
MDRATICEICDLPVDGETNSGIFHDDCCAAFAAAHADLNGPCCAPGEICMWRLGDAVPCNGSRSRPHPYPLLSEAANGR